MTTTCLISNFNYASYVGDAIEGALRQTVSFDQIVVVDDGSTDGSLELLTTTYGNHPRIEIVAKANAGQLSCFNEGFARATGDIVFFLDADDVYEPDYVERALDVYARERECDFLYCGRRLFGQQDGLLLEYPHDRDLGYSVIRAAYLHQWIGAATSCLSMRRQVLNKILPLPFEDDWRVRADDCLVFGASLAGARKRFLARPLVRYRVHGKNHFRGQAKERGATYCRRLAINRLFEYLERTLCYNVPKLAEFHHREFCTIESPTFKLLGAYVRISLSAQISPLRRFGCFAVMLGHYIRNVRHSNSHAKSVVPTATEPDLALRRVLPEFKNSPTPSEAWMTPRQRRAA